MNKQNALARSLSLLAVTLLLFTSFACLLAPSEVVPTTDTGASAAQYSYDNLYSSDTVFNNHVFSRTLSSDVRDMATGDLNGDGITDVVIATPTEITIYNGTGNGALGSSFVIPLKMGDIRKIAVGDLDENGKDNDIAATYVSPSDGKYRVGIFRQEEGYATNSTLQIETYNEPWQVVVGDFGLNSHSFAVICQGNQNIGEAATMMLFKWPYLTKSDFKDFDIPGYSNLRLLTAGDVNMDGHLDLVVGDAYGSTILVLTHPGAFTSPWPQTVMNIGGSISDIHFMDYSGSGTIKDLVVVKSGQDSNQVEIRISGGSLPTTPNITFTDDGASYLAVGSVTGASSSDLVVLSSSENVVSLYPRQGSGLSSSHLQFPVNSGSKKVVALNGGVYVLSSGNSGAIEYFRYMDSGISNADESWFTTGSQPKEVCAGDVSFGIIAATYDGQNAVYVRSLSGESRVITTSNLPTSLYIGDLDGDSIGDLVIASQYSNSVSIFKGSSDFMSNNAPAIISLSMASPLSLTGGIIEAIGKDALIVGCSNGIDIVYNPLSGSPIQETIDTSSSGGRIEEVAIGRLSSSGAIGDIAALDQNGRIEIFNVKQSPALGDYYDSTYNAWLYMPNDKFVSMTVGDIDGDGRDDVAATPKDTTKLMVFKNTGFINSTQTSISISLSSKATQVRAGDLNDDGKDDLAVIYSSIPRIGIWLSKDSFTFSNPFDMTAGGIAYRAFLGDFNGDRRVDILASSSTVNSISYWLQKDLTPFASTGLSSTVKIDVGSTISFDASSSADSFSDRSSLTYYWNFGDGNTSTGKTAQNLYTTTGTYDGYLLVTDRSGLTGRADFKVKVVSLLTASFAVSTYNPLFDEEITVTDTSDAPNGIAYRSWDLGDGHTVGNVDSFNVSYSKPGSYVITLTVVDTEGKSSTANRTIRVLQATDTVKNIIANGGKTPFYMDEAISFEVIIKNSSLPNLVYAWDMDFDTASGEFNRTPGISVNQTTWSYSVPGEHTVCVRIESLNEEYQLTIFISNYQPVAKISASSDSPGNFTFDASNSWDSASDISSLSYRWNFGDVDGWTDWSNTTRVTKNYTVDGKYTVTLEVRDQWTWPDSTTYLAILDTVKPTVDLDQSTMVSHAYRGEDLVIKVNVTDLTGVERVLLIYTSNNETKTLVMSRISGTDTYVATIPAEDVTGDLSYYIDAVDGYDNHSKTSAMTINLTDRPNDFLMYVILAAVAALGAVFLIYYRSASMVVDDVFIIYEDGNMMAHQTRRLKPGMDDQVLGSMLVAIQNFVKDSFKDEASTGLNRMDFGEQKVLVEKGEHIYLAVVLHGKREGRVPQRMKEAIAKAESTYSQALEGWDGDLEKVRGIKDETNPLLKSSLKDFMSAIPFIGRESAGPVEMTTCQFCFTSFPAGDPKCPKCGTAPDSKPPTERAGEGGGQAS